MEQQRRDAAQMIRKTIAMREGIAQTKERNNLMMTKLEAQRARLAHDSPDGDGPVSASVVGEEAVIETEPLREFIELRLQLSDQRADHARVSMDLEKKPVSPGPEKPSGTT